MVCCGGRYGYAQRWRVVPSGPRLPFYRNRHFCRRYGTDDFKDAVHFRRLAEHPPKLIPLFQ